MSDETNSQPNPAREVRRRQGIQGLMGRIAAKRANVVASLVPKWTEAEFATLKPLAEKVKSKELSYYRACMNALDVLPGRSFAAIRQKIKHWVAYGRFTPNGKSS